MFGRCTISVIADTMFGMKIKAMDDPDDKFYVMAKKVMDIKPRVIFMFMLSKFNLFFFEIIQIVPSQKIWRCP